LATVLATTSLAQVIDKDNEIEAQDAYWKVVVEEKKVSEDEQIEFLQ
jgi:hypothetical protein